MKKKKVLLILGIILTILLFMSFSYAYYIKSYSQENSNIAKTKCLNLSITNEKNDIKLDEQYPIPDSEGKKLVPYQFTITNTCEQFISYNVNLEALEGTTMDSNAIKVMVNNEAPVNLATLDVTQTSINNSVESRTLVTGSLGSGDSVDYAIRLWMDYGDSADLSSMNKVFNSKVVVTATIGTYKPSDYVSTLHDAILVNEYGVTDVDNAISKIEAKGEPDLKNTAPIIEWVEKEGSQINVNVVKINNSFIKSDDKTSNLTENDSLMKLYRDKEFDSLTGKYKLTNYIYANPADVNYDNEPYYFIRDSINYNAASGKFYSESESKDTEIYRILTATSNIEQRELSGTIYDVNVYTLTVIPMSESEVVSDKSDKGLYADVDDYGKTYYFRGNVTNNNVYFGGYYWQIVRINGDGSIRLMYNGTEKNASDKNQGIGIYSYNAISTKPAYSGYMYGNDVTTRESSLKNEVSSTVKNAVDNWYVKNILNKGLENYISDSGFCNDRNITLGDGVSTTATTNYAAYARSYSNKATFKCTELKRDLFTVNNFVGNQALTYPVGIITYDELAYAGMDTKHLNKMTWVYSSQLYWTMSPSFFYSEAGLVVNLLQYSGWLASNSVDYGRNVRPVINLKADVEISGGIGTINDPYTIKEKS